MPPNPPDIAVVIPALNAATHLRTALSSLAAQDVGYEAVLVDGGSRDDTVAIAAEAGVRVISAPGTSIYEAHNRGFAETRAPAIVLLNADDVLLPGALEAWRDALARAPTADIVRGRATFAEIDGAGVAGPVALFPDRLRMALVPGHDVDLVALDLAAELHLRLPLNDPLPQHGRHPLGVVGIEVEFLGDLLVREVQAHEVQDQDPDPQRLVVPGEDRLGQVIEAAAAGPALVTLPLRLGLIPALLDNPVRIAMGAADTRGPAEVANHLVALGVVDDPQDVDEHRRCSLRLTNRSGGLLGLDCRAGASIVHSSPWNTG